MSIDNLQPTRPNGGTEAAQVLHYFNDNTARTVYVSDVEFPYPDGALIVSRTDTCGIITHANDAFVNISGWSREEIIGAPHCILRHPHMPKVASVNFCLLTLRRLPRPNGLNKRSFPLLRFGAVLRHNLMQQLHIVG